MNIHNLEHPQLKIENCNTKKNSWRWGVVFEGGGGVVFFSMACLDILETIVCVYPKDLLRNPLKMRRSPW